MQFYFFYKYSEPVVVAFDMVEFSSTIDIIRFENVSEVYKDVVRYGFYLGHK